MTKKEFIEKFHLTKTVTKCCFWDGLIGKVRTLYIDNNGKMFVFCNNDLCSVTPYKYNTYTEGMEEIKCILGAEYNWYH